MATGFFSDERCFWHGGGNYALTLPLGGLVQPLAAGGLPENPETKRRLKNLMEVTGLLGTLTCQSAPPADRAALERVHPASYLDAFKAMSDKDGGEIGYHAPFLTGGYEIAALSTGLACAAVEAVATGALENAYALSRPPGHHCLPDNPNGFCLFNNIAVAIQAARAKGQARRFVVLDWDVHHGNGTEAIFYEDPDVLTISLHQENNYPVDSGALSDRGAGAAIGTNINVPLPPGSGHAAYLYTMERIVIPAITAFRPDMIIVACGFDAAIFDPLASMLATAETYRALTDQIKQTAHQVCAGKLVLVHEGGYSEAYVPFCGHATIATLAGSQIEAPDPLGPVVAKRQPNGEMDLVHRGMIDRMATELEL